MLNRKLLKVLSLVTAAAVSISVVACKYPAIDKESGSSPASTGVLASGSVLNAEDLVINEELSNSDDSEHVIEADGETADYSNVKITKTGDSDQNDEADFYGDNSAVFATNGASLTLSDMVIDTDGAHANAVFSYGEGTTVNVSDSVIKTSGNCSGGIMTTGGGTMNATNLTVHTTGNSSASIRSDRGGGTVTVNGGSYATDGTGSPAIYSTADITVNDSKLESTASQGIVVEGKNSVTLNNVTLTADNNTQNSDKSDRYQAVMIYQSMSGDADEGLASFSMNGGSLNNANGDIFFVNNTVANITLENAAIVNRDTNGVLLRAEAAGWGSEGSNGGKVNLYLKDQKLDGDIVVDEVSALNMYIDSSSDYTGAVNAENKGEVYVEIGSGSKWILTGDSYISSLSCEEGAIDLNGHNLYVDGKQYAEGSSSAGEAITLAASSGPDKGTRDGAPPEKPNGKNGLGEGGTPPEKPDDKGGPQAGGTPPDKPDGNRRPG